MRRMLLDAAYALFTEGGLEAITIRAVALKAKVAVMTPYNYFENKADMLESLWDSVIDDLLIQQKAAVSTHTLPRDRLKANIESFLAFWETDPTLYQFVYMPPLDRAGEIKVATTSTSSRFQLWEFSKSLTADFAASIGADLAEVETATHLRHFVVMGFLHTSLIYVRSKENMIRLRPMVVEQAIETCERHLLKSKAVRSPRKAGNETKDSRIGQHRGKAEQQLKEKGLP